MNTVFRSRARLWGIVLPIMLLFFAIAAWMSRAAPQGHTEIPLLFRQHSFTSATLAEAVNYYVAIGEDASIKQLSALAKPGDNRYGVYADQRIEWVCRILFQPQGGQPLRDQELGGPWDLPQSSMPSSDWPLFPLVASGSSYFVLSQSYFYDAMGQGPETTAAYLEYCRQNGNFRRDPIPVPTRFQALHDLATLKKSHLWQKLPWNKPNGKANYPEMSVWGYMKDQALNIPLTKAH